MDAETSKRCDSLARIIATPPAGGAAEQGQYWNNIGPQLLDMARRSAKVSLNRAPSSTKFSYSRTQFDTTGLVDDLIVNPSNLNP